MAFCQRYVPEVGGGVRAEGERRTSRSIVTSVALRGFVGVVKFRLERRPTAGQACTLDAFLRRLVALRRPRDTILERSGRRFRVTAEKLSVRR